MSVDAITAAAERTPDEKRVIHQAAARKAWETRRRNFTREQIGEQISRGLLRSTQPGPMDVEEDDDAA